MENSQFLGANLIDEAAVSKFVPRGMGWIPDLPDPRDYTCRHDKVLALLKQLKRRRRKKLPDAVDLRSDDEGKYFTEVEDQGPLNSSTAFAVLSLVEYFERRIRGHTFAGSKRFLYKVTRNRLRLRGDTGADLRTTLKTLVQFGVAPEEYWPYDIENFDEEPSPFVYGLAKPLSGVRYFRLDEPNSDGAKTWETVKSFLVAGFPVVFGFSVPSSLTRDAEIPYRPELDSIRGGQAVVAVGYKKDQFGRGQHGLLVRSSWGREWGGNGNGWLPVGYLRHQLGSAFWSLVSEKWVNSAELVQPSAAASVRRQLAAC